jgi:hypothetical protein
MINDFGNGVFCSYFVKSFERFFIGNASEDLWFDLNDWIDSESDSCRPIRERFIVHGIALILVFTSSSS